jgi:DNA-directed RNA polymerase subunit RPC12/RpoP
MPNQLLHELRHGQPICETAMKDRFSGQFRRDERWIWDTGVRFCAWNHSRSGFVTGSSDGVVKIWDVFRATEDAHTADLVRLNSGVMTAAYSPDFSRLIVGEVNKSITVLDVGQMGDQEVEEFAELYPPNSPRATADAMDLDRSAKQAAKLLNGRHATAPTRRTGRGACTIPLCRELGTRAVDESTTANDALSQARIPANLRAVEAYAPPRARAPMDPARPCRGCGASTSLLASEDVGDGVWCQRCRFGCFRCGRFVRVAFPYDVVECRDCGLAWSVGAAGYDLIRKDQMDVDGAPLARVERRDAWEGELAKHYHSLWGTG